MFLDGLIIKIDYYYLLHIYLKNDTIKEKYSLLRKAKNILKREKTKIFFFKLKIVQKLIQYFYILDGKYFMSPI